ncbi:MAG: DUF3078 domain-containing protein [Prevotellaceae bacterium]|jgi:hypothetical protein|nr:DUF3078 domain-containing protein [Prevotellaceae bacterium]
MLNGFDNINKYSFNLSLVKGWRIILLFFLFPVFSAYSQSRDDDPQLLIARFENEMQGIAPHQKDSIKYTLQSAYIREFRNSGKETAYDSLQIRIDRLLTGKGNTQVKSFHVKKPAASVDEEKKKSLPNAQEPKYNTAQVSSELKKTKRIADSLTAQALKTGKPATVEPIFFDSISHTDFFNYFQVHQPEFKNTTEDAHLKYNGLDKKSALFRFQKKQRRRTVNAFAVTYPELIEYYDLLPYDDKSGDIRKSGKAASVDVDEYKTPIVLNKLPDFPTPEKQGYWSSNGKLNVQFSQYYVTKNWYKGGDPNATLLSLLEYAANYNKNEKLIWNNTLDVRIGFFNSRIDTLRAFRVNNDVFRITSQLGYQTVYKKWYYSLYGEFNTSMFTGYAGTNSSDVVTEFLSPSRIFTSLGLDYRYNKNTAVLIAPMAYKLIFLVSDRIDPLSVGIRGGKSSSSFGYMLQAKTNWQFSREINVNSNFNLFSSYGFENVEFNWETVGNFVINRHLSTRLSLIMRYDNTPKIPEKSGKSDRSDNRNYYEKPKLQVQEQLSLGFYFRL